MEDRTPFFPGIENDFAERIMGDGLLGGRSRSRMRAMVTARLSDHTPWRDGRIAASKTFWRHFSQSV